jgi:hypothetical protein
MSKTNLPHSCKGIQTPPAVYALTLIFGMILHGGVRDWLAFYATATRSAPNLGVAIWLTSFLVPCVVIVCLWIRRQSSWYLVGTAVLLCIFLQELLRIVGSAWRFEERTIEAVLISTFFIVAWMRPSVRRYYGFSEP